MKLFVAIQASVFRFDQRPAKVGKKLNDRLCQAIEGYRKLFEQVVFQHVERHTTMNDDVKRSFFVVVLRHQFRVGANQVRVKRRCCIALDGTTFAEVDVGGDIRRLSFALQHLAVRIAAPARALERNRSAVVVVLDRNVVW